MPQARKPKAERWEVYEASGEESLSEMEANLMEAEMIWRCGEGDSAALEWLVRRYHRPLLNFTTRMLDDPDTAEDVVQETFLRLLRAAPRFKAQGKVSTWVFAIAANLCRDELRRRKRRPIEPLETLQGAPDEDPPVAQQALNNVLYERVREAVQKLPPEQRMAVILFHYEGLSHSEIAQICGCPVGTVKSRLHYAHKRLYEMLKDEWEEEGDDSEEGE